MSKGTLTIEDSGIWLEGYSDYGQYVSTDFKLDELDRAECYAETLFDALDIEDNRTEYKRKRAN